MQLNNVLTFSPERKENLPISAFTFLRIGGIQLSEGMKVIEKSSSSHQDSCKLMKIVPTSDLAFSIVGVLHHLDSYQYNPSGGSGGGGGGGNASNYYMKNGELSQELLGSNISGFISIVQMDLENDRMTILSPCPGALPSTLLLVGSIKWVE
jgi:hypothetical protein